MEFLRAPDEKQFRLVAVVFGAGFFLSVVFHYLMAGYFHQGYPESTFLYRPDDQFGDFTNMFLIVKDGNPYHSSHWFSSNYFPLANLFFMGFASVGDLHIALILFLGLFLGVYALVVLNLAAQWKSLSIFGVVTIAISNYPVLFALDRANLELYLFLLILGFLYFHFVDKRPILAAVLLALATSMKLYPGVFFLLLLRDPKAKPIFVFLLTCTVATLGSLLMFQGGFFENLRWMADALAAFTVSSNGPQALQHNSSLAGLLALGYYVAGKLFWQMPLDRPDSFAVTSEFSNVYTVLVVLAFLVLAYGVISRKLTAVDSILGLTIAMVLFPVVSYDYKLIYFLIPLTLSLTQNQNRVPLVLLTLLMVPKDYLVIKADITIAVVLNSMIQLVLLGMVYWRLFKPTAERLR